MPVSTSDLITLAVAAAVGFVVCWLSGLATRARLRERLARLESLESEHKELLQQYRALQDSTSANTLRLESALAELRTAKLAAEERIAELREERTRSEAATRELQARVEAGAQENKSLAEQLASAQSSERALAKRLEELQAEHATLRERFGALQEEHYALQRRQQTQEAEFAQKQRGYEEKMELLQKAEQQLSQQFENLANRIFEEKGNAFKAANQESLEKLLKPFQENLQGLHNDVKEASKERHTLSREIERIVTEANALTQALKGDSKVQGDWGEMVLSRLLESTGLRRNEEYVLQQSFDVEGGRARPDAIINLPERRNIVIDAKVSLTAYTNYCNADDEQSRNAYLAAHVESVKKHIRDLAERRYDHIEAIQSLDFTLMFVPVEPAYFAALQKEPGLVTFAMEKRVIIVSPTTLFATLKTIERIWSYERQNQNTQKIVRQATSLYDKLCGFVENMDKLGRAIANASNTYDMAYGQLKSGRGNLISQAAKLREMGLEPKKALALDLVEEALEEDGESELAALPATDESS